MAKSSSPAKRTNRILFALVVLALAGSGVTAAVGNGPSTSAATTVPPVTPPSDSLPGARPAETTHSWFNHGFSGEQFDYEMAELSCEELEDSITPDMCAVIGSGKSHYMMVATEGYWDPQDRDSNGDVWIPLNITMFTMREDNKMPRAASVLDGFVEKQYTANRAQIDAYVATVNGQSLLVLHKHLSSAKADPYDLLDELQVIAVSPTGAPTVVATYIGPQMSLQSTSSSLEISALRYRPTAETPNAEWYTRISLAMNEGDFGMTERITSSGTPVNNGAMLTKVGTYEFPVGRGTPSEAPAA